MAKKRNQPRSMEHFMPKAHLVHKHGHVAPHLRRPYVVSAVDNTRIQTFGTARPPEPMVLSETDTRRMAQLEETKRLLAEHLAQTGNLERLVSDSEFAAHFGGVAEIAKQIRQRSVARRRAAKTLDVCAAFIPIRVANEEFGDLLEDLNRRIADGQKNLAYFRLVTGVLWTAVNVMGYFIQKALGQRKTG
jgi:hypothetical protein